MTAANVFHSTIIATLPRMTSPESDEIRAAIASLHGTLVTAGGDHLPLVVASCGQYVRT
ncbi:MAG: hypothetical protein ACRERE_23655 [Candidatus Entotheonellia bacterium]